MKSLLAATVVIAAPAWADDTSAAVTKPIFGCTDLAIFRDGVRLLEENDVEALKKLIRGNKCHSFQIGEKTFLRYISEDALYACVRPVGEPDCFWTFPDLTVK
ncbi:hypothetical protein [Mesorhizobium sp.]|uniref:hypothetical protein n=1 Tax=Mesorhizobium sp. TaxID=1871066 RepID=UPI000FE824D7|nr:hypothetical protein [Mesorhizobium sp.]RWM29449.1 MAG: hypothetical protein EOR74_07150 [Mesorhizobium sp.]